MSRIYEALKRVEGTRTVNDDQKGATSTPAAPALDEYPREAAVTAERRARTGEKAAKDAPTAWSGSAERIVSTAQRIDARKAPRTDASWSAKLVAAPGASVAMMNQYRRLAAVLEDAQVERGVKTVMVTSAVAGEGKTLTVANLALMLSESLTRRVLLVDADLRHPTLHQVFSTPNRSGLSDALAHEGGELPIVEVSPSLSLLPSGHTGANPLAALTSERMVAVLEECSNLFDWVLIDTAPVVLLPDARLLARLTRAVVFVIGAGSTPSELVERAVADLGTDRIMGTVLNRVPEGSVPGADHHGSPGRRSRF